MIVFCFYNLEILAFQDFVAFIKIVAMTGERRNGDRERGRAVRKRRIGWGGGGGEGEYISLRYRY